MSAPVGEGLYLVLIDYGTEGQVVRRFKKPADVLAFITGGECHGPFIVAKEIGICIQEPSAG